MPGRVLAAFLGSLILGLVACPATAQVEITTVIRDAGQTPPRDGRPPAATVGTATLRGRITAADNGQPLRKAQVTMQPLGLPGAGPQPVSTFRTMTTDGNGRYEFKEVVAGRYNVSAQKGSYVNRPYGQERPNDPARPVDVRDGQTIEKIDIALVRGGVITGRVLDEFGEPASEVTVSAMRNITAGGTRRMVNVGRPSTTNDIGEFRLYGLPPGDYYVSASSRNNNGSPYQDDSRNGYAPTYYPGTADVGSAQKLAIAAGQIVNDITLPLLVIRTARITGTAVDSRGTPIRGSVQAISMAMLGGPLAFNNGQIRPDGSFTIAGLVPNDYALQASTQTGLDAQEPEFAAADVTITGDGDVTGVRLVGAKASSLTGRVVIRTGSSRALKLSGLRVSLQPAPVNGITFSTGPQPLPASVGDDGSFQVKTRAGAMRIFFQQGLTAPWTISAVRVRGTDVIDTSVEVRPGEDLADVEVELTDRVTEVSGLLINGRSEPVKGAWVVLFSRDRERWKAPTRYVRAGRADADGRYKVTGLPPGEYLAWSTETDEPGTLSDPDLLDRIETRATALTLREAEPKTIDLRLGTKP